jgi:glycosyltransferase involved in cell wall biosynthesis
MSNITFSLVIPFYSNTKLLDDCYSSALNQTLPFTEIIIVNDGSPSVSHLELQLRFPQATVLSQLNQGPSRARNLGLAYASSDYICFLDSDDILFPSYLQSISTLILGCSLLPPFLSVRYTKKFVHDFSSLNFLQPFDAPRSFNYSIYSYAFNTRLVSSSSLCVNKSYVFSCFSSRLFPENFRSGEDVIASIRLLSISKGIFLDRPLVIYRVHGSSQSSNSPFSMRPNIFSYLIRREHLSHPYISVLFLHLFVKTCLSFSFVFLKAFIACFLSHIPTVVTSATRFSLNESSRLARTVRGLLH